MINSQSSLASTLMPSQGLSSHVGQSRFYLKNSFMMKAEAQRSVDIIDAICEYVSEAFRLIPQVWNVRGGVGEIE